MTKQTLCALIVFLAGCGEAGTSTGKENGASNESNSSSGSGFFAESDSMTDMPVEIRLVTQHLRGPTTEQRITFRFIQPEAAQERRHNPVVVCARNLELDPQTYLRFLDENGQEIDVQSCFVNRGAEAVTLPTPALTETGRDRKSVV